MKNYSPSEIEAFRKRAHQRIPAGAHTYSKADNQFPANAPAFIQQAKGSRCTDLEGNTFIDYGMGLFSVSLGHAYPPVLEAIAKQLPLGNSFTRPSLLEGAFAEELCELIPCAEMVKFAKNGSDVTSAAVRLARCYTGRDLVVRIKEQPFHSFDDWFIGSTSRPGGVPQNIRDQTISASYNDIEGLKALFERYENQIACILMEPATFEAPVNDYLKKVRELCTQSGVVLIFDEIISGFRWDLRGAQHHFKVTPDLATFGKGIANGFACATIVGKRELMSLGNMDGPAFLLSCTFGSELVGLTAAKATLQVYKEEEVISHFWNYGKALKAGIKAQIDEAQIGSRVKIAGYDCRPGLSFMEEDGGTSFALKTLFLQEMVKGGVLMDRICISYSHRAEELQKTLQATEHAFQVLGKAIANDSVAESIVGEIVQPVFTH